MFTLRPDEQKRYEEEAGELCGCLACRHFRKTFGKTFRRSACFLEKLGIGEKAEIEIMELGLSEDRKSRSYYAYYLLAGELRGDGIRVFEEREDGGLYAILTLYRKDSERTSFPWPGEEGEWFILEIETLLPAGDLPE